VIGLSSYLESAINRAHIHLPKNIADKASDLIASSVGSWAFVGTHLFWFATWILFRIENYPFGLLTLIVSLEAIFLSTFVMMSQNRQANKDRARDDHEAAEVSMLFEINQNQLRILQLLEKDTHAE
jgi:uncharacterized membrane protein